MSAGRVGRNRHSIPRLMVATIYFRPTAYAQRIGKSRYALRRRVVTYAWCPIGDSNPEPTRYERVALPVELKGRSASTRRVGGRLSLAGGFCKELSARDWQGWQDLNLRMRESKSRAFPLGYSPVFLAVLKSTPETGTGMYKLPAMFCSRRWSDLNRRHFHSLRNALAI